MNKILKITAIIVALVLITGMLCMSVGADFGDYSGDSDWGDSGWDDDGYDSYDYYGDSDYGSHGSGGGSISTVFVAVVIVVIVIIVASSKKKNGTKSIETEQTDLRPIGEYNTIDPNFDSAKLERMMSNLYVQLQNCWTAKDISSVRNYFTDAAYAQFDRQLSGYRQRGETNYVEKIAVLSCTTKGFYQQGGMDRIVVRLETRITDYTLNDKSGALVKGSRTAEKFMVYDWTLIRKSGLTSEAGRELGHINCPNCGAPLDINASAKCPYCDSVLTRADHDFVIHSISAISQRTA